MDRETIEFEFGVKAHIEHDEFVERVDDLLGQHDGLDITYHGRYILGTKEVDDIGAYFLDHMRDAVDRGLIGEDDIRAVILEGYDRENDRESLRDCLECTYSRLDAYFDFLDSAVCMTDRYHGAMVNALIRVGYCILPVYAYVHSGASIKVGPGGLYSNLFDGGQSGFVVAGPEFAKLSGFDLVEDADRIEECVRGFVEEFDLILQGRVYGYVIETPEDENSESCWGFVGEKAVEEAAREAAEHFVELYNDPAGAGI